MTAPQPLRQLTMAVSILISTVATANGPWSNIVQRRTNDRDHDLVHELIRVQRFDDAVEVCEARSKGLDPMSDLAAKWAIRRSQIAAAAKIATGAFSPDDVAKAQAPAAELLRSYPQHPRALFIKAQLTDVEKRSAQHRVVMISVSPASDQQTAAVFAALARATQRMQALSEEVSDARSQIDSRQSSLDEKAISLDLLRLEHELHADVVAMALLQTNLFADGSRDQVSAASKAEQAAIKALQSLPNDSIVRNEVERMRVQAILIGGELDRAATQLQQFARTVGLPIPPNVLAMRIKLDLKRQQTSSAKRLLDAFYGIQPANAPQSIEMDLVRLDYLVATSDSGVGDWLDSIEDRNGAYARRRAESLSLAKVRAADNVKKVDPSIIAAQGQEWLRRDDPERAGQLLAIAAKSEPDPDRAIQRATEAASAFIKAGDLVSAANTLASIAVANTSAKNAAAAHLQAAVVTSKTKSPDAGKEIEAILIATCETWPGTESSLAARKWLIAILTRQSRWLERAQVASRILHDATQPQIDQAMDFWVNAVVNTDVADRDNVVGQFTLAMKNLKTDPKIAPTYAATAVCLLNAAQLFEILDDQPSDDFSRALLKFRRSQTVSTGIEDVPANRLAIARWRLMQDGDDEPRNRKAIATILSQWTAGSVSDQARLLVWSGDSKAAIDLVTKESKTASNPLPLWKNVATALVESNENQNLKSAVQIWDRLAGGLPRGKPAWHEAKIEAIELLKQIGQSEEATRRAKYVLLTNPPADAELKRRYQAVAQ